VSKRRRVALHIVAEGYDRVAERYARWVAEDLVDEVRPRYTAVLLDALPSRSAGARARLRRRRADDPATRRAVRPHRRRPLGAAVPALTMFRAEPVRVAPSSPPVSASGAWADERTYLVRFWWRGTAFGRTRGGCGSAS
jgi:hypothetical protein